MPFYAVRTGKKPGVYEKWSECQQQTVGFTGAQFKKFDTREEAEGFVKGAKPKRKSSTSSTSSGEIKKSPNKRGKGTKKASKESSESESESDSDDSDDSDDAPPVTKKSKPAAASKTAKGKPSAESTSDDGEHVYMDGCSFNKGKVPVAGVGIFWSEGSSDNISELLKIPGKPTLNRAMIHAGIRVVNQIKKLGKTKVVINSDNSNLVQSMSSWVLKWKSNGWKTSSDSDVANKEDLQELVKAAEGLDLKWNLVDADDEKLKEADRLANEGARKP